MKAAGWLTSMIERARSSGLDNHDIAAALESSIGLRPLTLTRDDRDRLVGRMADAEVTLNELFSLPDEDPRIR